MDVPAYFSMPSAFKFTAWMLIEIYFVLRLFYILEK